MIRRFLRFLFGGILKLFFRRIEVVGVERIPRTGPVLFTVNHPSALVDALFPLCFAPRPVSFLAKAPLFRMPVIGALARALDVIPVYRRQDPGTTMEKNRETFMRAREVLEKGGTIAIAPEGTSHSDPALRPLKTGAARIALGAGTSEPVTIVPVGLFYSMKGTFRSEALVFFGEPFPIDPVPPGPDGEPPADRVDRVTDEIATALSAVVLQADEHAALDLVRRAEHVLGADAPLADSVLLRQRMVRGYRALREQAPDELEHLQQRLQRLESEFDASRLDPGRVATGRIKGGAAIVGTILFIARVLLFLPLAVPGIVLHYPAYRLIGALARRVGRDHEDVLATAKIVGALVFFPLTWAAVAVLVGRTFGWLAGIGTLVLVPLTGYAALMLVERFDRFGSAARAFGFSFFEPESFARLAAEQEAFRQELLAVAGKLGV